MKQAQAMQFNWIFVVVAGAIILVFFLGFGVQYVGLQKTRENVEASKGIDQIINGLKEQEQFKSIELHNDFTFEFKCDSFVINKDTRSTQYLNGKIIFTQNTSNINTVYAWTKEFKKVYRIDNLVYLADSRRHFYFILDDNVDYVNNLYSGIPSTFDNIEEIKYDDLVIGNTIKGINNEFIFFGSPSQDKIDELKDKGTIIIIDPLTKMIIFDDGQDFIGIIDDSLIYGAIFSGSSSSYKCSYDSLVKKFNTINNIYQKKAQNTQNCCSNGFCDYTNLINAINGLTIDSSDSYVSSIEQMNRENANQCKVIF
jgi:hypothetical protein